MRITAETLNYHHLLYFWSVARAGSIVAASEQLLISQPTISGQLKELERALGERLFDRVGRRLVLTEVGQTVFGYADEMFGLARQLVEAVGRVPTDRPLRLAVGIADGLPKLVARMLLEPALRLPRPVRLQCREGRVEELLIELAAFRLDVVLSDAPAAAGGAVRSYSHLLGESGVSFYAAPALAQRLRRRFPRSLTGAPVFLPAANAALRRVLDPWLDARDLRPHVIGEFDDSALLKTFGQTGLAAFPAPTAAGKAICRQYGVREVGRVEGVAERFYALTVERKLKHPAVVAITEAARDAGL